MHLFHRYTGKHQPPREAGKKTIRLPDHPLKRGAALGLCVATLLSTFTMLLGATGTRTAGSGASDLYIREADKSTMDSYQEASLGWYDGTEVHNEYGTRFAGEVWADKSVFANGMPGTDFDGSELALDVNTDGLNGTINIDEYSDFLHVFSTLGSSEQITVDGPFDVCFVVDVSASMQDDTDGYGVRPGSAKKEEDAEGTAFVVAQLFEHMSTFAHRAHGYFCSNFFFIVERHTHLLKT